jgi:pyruvate dehydrogenase (quinone)
MAFGKQPGYLKAALARRSRSTARRLWTLSSRRTMPNLPHVEPNMIGNYALAKIKEAVLSVTG